MKTIFAGSFKEIPHNPGSRLAGDFQPSAACKFLDLPPGLASPFSLKTVHWTVFRALEPSKPAKFASHGWLKFTSPYDYPIMRYFLSYFHNSGSCFMVGGSTWANLCWKSAT
jgi:hypothetical protein